MSLIPGLGRSSGGRHGHPLQYSCLENPMDRGAWRATVHGFTKKLNRTEATQHACTQSHGTTKLHLLQALCQKGGRWGSQFLPFRSVTWMERQMYVTGQYSGETVEFYLKIISKITGKCGGELFILPLRQDEIFTMKLVAGSSLN